MFDLKQILTSLIVSVVVVVGFGLVGGNDQSLGVTGTRFPNGISADSTSPVAGEVRGKTFTTYNAAATSSAYIYSGLAATGGQLIVEDTDAAGCTGIAALNGTVVAATVTCP
jgi:hypothetical protein